MKTYFRFCSHLERNNMGMKNMSNYICIEI
jgi:hypothetical protein